MDKRLAMEIKRVMGESSVMVAQEVRDAVMQSRHPNAKPGSIPASPATETAPLNGGIRQMVGASALSSLNSTSRESLPNSCERSLGDALKEELRKQSADNVGAVRTSPTIITEPVAAENNKQRER